MSDYRNASGFPPRLLFAEAGGRHETKISQVKRKSASDETKIGKRGRPATHASANDRLKAYRARKRQEGA